MSAIRGGGVIAFATLILMGGCNGRAGDTPALAWSVGAPIVSYWAGPGYPDPGGTELNDAAAVQLAEGGWNLVWCREKELDVVQRHGLRGLISDPLLTPSALEDAQKREALNAFIERVRQHPGLYAYHLKDEPSAGEFQALGKLVAHLRARDPAHLPFINLLPVYAENRLMGIEGNHVVAYTEHLRQYVESVRPGLLSYDHYQFTNTHDTPEYFLNLALIREKALAAGIPFMNIVQASCWWPGSHAALPDAPRIPNGDEMRYLVYTTLAYGAQGISYYVYYYPRHSGGIALADGTPTPLYHALKPLNREFVAIAKELQPLKSLGVAHAGMLPPGTEPVPKTSLFTLDPPVAAVAYKAGEPVQGVVLGFFGAAGKTDAATTHVLVVNLDYKAEKTVGLQGPAPLDLFDTGDGLWKPIGNPRAELRLLKGGGALVRVCR